MELKKKMDLTLLLRLYKAGQSRDDEDMKIKDITSYF